MIRQEREEKSMRAKMAGGGERGVRPKREGSRN